jgi:hypothetical protein
LLIRAAFFGIFGSLAAGGAPFTSQGVRAFLKRPVVRIIVIKMVHLAGIMGWEKKNRVLSAKNRQEILALIGRKIASGWDMAAVACYFISDFLSSIVTGLSLWVSFLLYIVAAICSPTGGFLHSDRVVPMGILPPPYGGSSLLPYRRIPP